MDETLWIWGVRAAGVLHLVTVALAHFTPIPAGWEENLARLPDVHRRFAIAQNVFIGGVMIFGGIVSVMFASDLVAGTTSPDRLRRYRAVVGGAITGIAVVASAVGAAHVLAPGRLRVAVCGVCGVRDSVRLAGVA
jgi:hypothetical protein